LRINIRNFLGFLVVLPLFPPLYAFPITSIWGGGTGDWSAAGAWSGPVGAPGAGYQVLIDNGNAVSSTVTISVVTPVLNNIAVDGGDALILNGTLSAGVMRSFGGFTINSGGAFNAGVGGFVQDQSTASTLVNAGGQFLNSGSYSQGNGSTTVNGQLGTDLFHVTGGTVTTGSGGVLDIGAGGYTQDNFVSNTVYSGGQMNVTGNYSQGSGSTTVAGTLSTALFHVTGGVVSIGSGGVLDIGAGGFMQGVSGTSTTISAGGSLTVTGGDYGQEENTSTVLDGTLTADRVNNSGALYGAGAVSGDFANLGTLSPGDGGSGAFTVVGDYSQTGILDADFSALNSGNFLSITGAAALAGTLDVTFMGGFLPQLGDIFPVMSFGSFTGAFDFVNTNITLPPGERLEALYSPTGVSVELVSAPSEATEPATFGLAGIALAGCMWGAARARRRSES